MKWWACPTEMKAQLARVHQQRALLLGEQGHCVSGSGGRKREPFLHLVVLAGPEFILKSLRNLCNNLSDNVQE